MLVAFYGYSIHSRAHYDDLDTMLRNVTEHVASELVAAPTALQRVQVLAASAVLGMDVRVYDGTGHVQAPPPALTSAPHIDPRAVVARPSRVAYGPIVALMPAVRRVQPGRGAFGLVQDTNGVRWRVYVLPVNTATPYVVSSVPLDEFDAAVRRVAWLMAVMALLGSAAAFVTAWLLAGRVLRPVAMLSETARAIARSGQLSERVHVGESRGELEGLAAAFNEMLERLERAHLVQQRFISDASHELRAPLTVVQGNLELLLRHAMTESDRRDAVREAHTEANRLGRLVADLLALARADAGISVQPLPVELDRVLLDVLGEARHLGPNHFLEVGDLQPVTIYGDPDRLKQLLLILIDNAVKYTPPGGRITASLRRIDNGAPRGKGIVEMTIRDTGIGIAADELSRVFDRFYRADAARVRDPGGTGLGLPIARWVAAQHGGSVTLASEPGGGTVATVRLSVGATALATA